MKNTGINNFRGRKQAIIRNLLLSVVEIGIEPIKKLSLLPQNDETFSTCIKINSIKVLEQVDIDSKQASELCIESYTYFMNSKIESSALELKMIESPASQNFLMDQP